MTEKDLNVRYSQNSSKARLCSPGRCPAHAEQGRHALFQSTKSPVHISMCQLLYPNHMRLESCRSGCCDSTAVTNCCHLLRTSRLRSSRSLVSRPISAEAIETHQLLLRSPPYPYTPACHRNRNRIRSQNQNQIKVKINLIRHNAAVCGNSHWSVQTSNSPTRCYSMPVKRMTVTALRELFGLAILLQHDTTRSREPGSAGLKMNRPSRILEDASSCHIHNLTGI